MKPGRCSYETPISSYETSVWLASWLCGRPETGAQQAKLRVNIRLGRSDRAGRFNAEGLAQAQRIGTNT